MAGSSPPRTLPRRRYRAGDAWEERNWRKRRADPLLSDLTWQMIAARRRAGLTQREVAARMGTTRSAVARLENGLFHRPRLTTVEAYAIVVGCHVEVSLVGGP
jgi:DNA-binding XRE family transcriptional regulator